MLCLSHKLLIKGEIAMDLVKIGKYIASKRKGLGLTQKQVAQKLGMSDKSVSKWERGICLPDVSIYMELCEILGISLNEFIAGEDLEQSVVVKKSEENIIQVTQDGNQKKKKLKIVIGLLTSLCILMASLFICLTIFQKKIQVNYIEPLKRNSTEMNIAEVFSYTDGAFLYNYVMDKNLNMISVYLSSYKKGKLQEKEKVGELSFGEKSVKKGMIAIVPDFENFKVRLILVGNGSKLSTDFDILQGISNREWLARSSSSSLEDRMDIEEKKEQGILALIYAENELSQIPLSEYGDKNIKSNNDYEYYLSVEVDK